GSSVLPDVVGELGEGLGVGGELGGGAGLAEGGEAVEERAGAAGDQRVEAGREALPGGGGHAAHRLVAEDRLQQLLADHGGGGAGADLEPGGQEGGRGE